MLALVIHDKVATVIAIVVGVVVYGVGLLAIGGLTEQEIRSMPKGIQIAGLLKKVHLLK